MSAAPQGWHYRRSLASRVTLLTTIAVGLSITAIAVGIYVVLRIQLQAALDDSLRERALTTAKKTNDIMLSYKETSIPAWLIGASDLRVAIVKHDGTVTILDVAEGDFPRLGYPEFEVLTGERAESIRTIESDTVAYRVVTVPVPASGGALVLAQSMAPQEQMYRQLGFVMLIFGLAGVVTAGFAGWAVATGALRPVRRLTTDVERIAKTQDLTPLPVEGDDEVASLAASFNRVLVALAASQDRQRQLVADASHELRTPLTSLRTNVDLLTQAGGSLSAEMRGELLADIRAQMDELTTLIGDLMELAREDAPSPVVAPVDLGEVVEHAVNRVRLRAPGVAFEVDVTPYWVVGEPTALERAVTNLLDNAAKWSPTGGTVRVEIAGGRLTVDDEGPGIAESDLPHVFDRFYRSPESRGMPGSGLGLAIVRQVTERSGGSIEAGRSPQGGARLTLRLPGSPNPPQPSA